MPQPLFIVRIADLERGKKRYEWELPLAWLRQCFDGTEAVADASGSLQFEATMTSRQVLIRGRAQAAVSMPCARTLEPVPFDLEAEIFLIFRPAAATHGTTKTPPGSGTKRAPRPNQVASPVAAPKKKTIHRPESELSEDDAAEDVYHGDHIELDDIVREFLLLELPMMPLRSDLRLEERPAIPPTPETPMGGAATPTVDPRLRPLAEIASRLRKTTKE